MSEELKHHGILGMKWGVRRTPEQLGRKRAAKGDAGESEGSRSKKSSSSPTKANKMTDEELRSRINRLNMEKQLRDLEAALTPQKKSVVKKLLGEAMQDLGRRSLSSIVGNIVDRTFNKNDFDLDSLKGMNPDKMSPDLLKKAAGAIVNAGKVEDWQKKRDI